MVLGEARYPRLATAWVSADEEPLQVNAGDEGLEVLALQYPAEALAVQP